MSFDRFFGEYNFPKLDIEESILIYIEDRMRDAYEAAYETGREEAYDDAYQEGREEGERIGWEGGYNQGFEDGKDDVDNFNTIYEMGKSTGFQDAIELSK